MRKAHLSALGAALSLMLAAGCSTAPKTAQPPAATSSAKVESVVLMHDKGGNPDYRSFYNRIAALTQSATGVSLMQRPYSDSARYQKDMRAALSAGTSPDLFTWWQAYYMKDLVDAGLVADLSDLWDKHKEFPQGLRESMSVEGKAYAFPTIVEYWGVWYNKAIFAKYDLAEPTTWSDFLQICATLKEAGITPMLQSEVGSWPTFILFQEMVARQDPQLYVNLTQGRVRYSDPRVKQAFKVWADLISSGYFTDPSTDLYSDGPRLLAQGKVAMIPCGTWFLPVLTRGGVSAEKVGIFVMPPVRPEAGRVVVQESSPVLISARAPHLAAAKKIADWWMSPAGSSAFARLVNQYPANPVSDNSYLAAAQVRFARKIVDDGYRVVTRYWEATPIQISEKAVKEFAKFIRDPSDVDAVLSRLDEIAAEYWASAQR